MSCNNCQNPTVTPTTSITYTVQYQAADGNCVQEEFNIVVEPCGNCEEIGLQANFSHTTSGFDLNVQDLSTVLPPNSVSYSGPEPKLETFPESEILRYQFLGTKYTAPEPGPATLQESLR